jgi:ABC-2 type transport system permease protein
VSAAGLVAAERIKLMSVRSPWWCAAVAVLGVVGLTALLVLTAPDEVVAEEGGLGANPFMQFGLVVVLVLAAVSVTTEYRYSTVRLTFEAAPNRTATMLAKALVVALACGVIGLLAAFGSWAAVWLLRPEAVAPLAGVEDWRMLAGAAPVFAAGAVLALAVGILVRHTAAAVSIVLVWTLLAEQLLGFIPEIGDDVERWLPFRHATNATSAGIEGMPFGPWGSMAYFAAVAAGLLVVSLVVLNRRDA